jgi:hypothetical protein
VCFAIDEHQTVAVNPQFGSGNSSTLFLQVVKNKRFGNQSSKIWESNN